MNRKGLDVYYTVKRRFCIFGAPENAPMDEQTNKRSYIWIDTFEIPQKSFRNPSEINTRQ